MFCGHGLSDCLYHGVFLSLHLWVNSQLHVSLTQVISAWGSELPCILWSHSASPACPWQTVRFHSHMNAFLHPVFTTSSLAHFELFPKFFTFLRLITCKGSLMTCKLWLAVESFPVFTPKGHVCGPWDTLHCDWTENFLYSLVTEFLPFTCSLILFWPEREIFPSSFHPRGF